MDYKGYEKLYLTDEDLNWFYNHNHELPYLLHENEYGLIYNGNEDLIDKVVCHEGINYPIPYLTVGDDFTGIMKPRNLEQQCAMELLKNEKIPIKLITGTFGSGKSMMCICAALEALNKHQFDKIIFVRNNVQVKDTDQLGALPGDMYDKTLPYLMPFADHAGGINGVEQLVDSGQLEVIPLAFLRGRSIRNSIIYSMESENLTKEHIQLIMGRVDEGSQLWLDGDIRQRDRVSFEKSKGLETMIDRLRGNRLFGYVHLAKSERSETAALADLLD